MSFVISPGNSKLGKIPSISLPPGETCPGQTEACAKACYASKYMKVFTSTARAYSSNLDSVLTEDWQVVVIRKLAKTQPAKFRIHVAGDFFSVGYIQAWTKIAGMFPKTQFLAYTRSWRVPKLRRALEPFRALPNVVLFASCDEQAWRAPRGWKNAHMGIPTYPQDSILCPGYGPKELQCDACGLCFRKLGPDVHFPIH